MSHLRHIYRCNSWSAVSTIEFYSNQWEGTLKIQDKEEIKQVKFMDSAFMNQLPLNEQSAFESLDHYRKHGKIMLK